MKINRLKLLLLGLVLITYSSTCNMILAQELDAKIEGVVFVEGTKDAVAFATVFLNEPQVGCITNNKGAFELAVPSGEITVGVSVMGYEPYWQTITTTKGKTSKLTLQIKSSAVDIAEINVKGESASSRVNKTAYNVQSIDIGAMKNTSANITQAISKMSGINIRESGGVGSDTELSLNGFTGSHVKIFIDGMPQNGNAAFSLNNIPAGFAERIEMYSGVVPIEFGADALGGVVNIITNKANLKNRYTIDASYSYGSFNTHKTYVKFGQTLAKSGFTYSLTAYQNYSDNNYEIDNYVTYYVVEEILGGLNTSFDTSDVVYGLERFHDTYHNETVIGSIGFANTSWADHLTLSLNYSQFYKDIQTGTTQNRAYGEKYSEGFTWSPTLEYSKKDFFIDGLDLRFVANYDTGYTHNADPATGMYNWYGEYTEYNLTPSDNESRNNSLGTNIVAKYVPNNKHNITVSNTVTSTSRITRSLIEGTNIYSGYDPPQYSTKSISGLSYLIRPFDKFESTIFAKHFYQWNQSLVEDESTGLSDQETRQYSKLGYGAAASYFVIAENLQSKLSYERAYRLPTTTEMFGDNDLEVGTFDLEPETSDNINLNLIYMQTFNRKHFLRLEGSLIYRYTYDYIIRTASDDGSSASYGNYGQVETKGYSLIARYDYDKYFSVGATFNNINPRDKERYVSEGSSQLNMTYGMRIPNQPYKYANADMMINFYNIFTKHDQISIMYNLFYQEEFTLYWEAVAQSSTKAKVPMQLSHSAVVNYSFRNNRYNISFEANNFTDEDLYDNYSLQKAGRAFYMKFRVNIFK